MRQNLLSQGRPVEFPDYPCYYQNEVRDEQLDKQVILFKIEDEVDPHLTEDHHDIAPVLVAAVDSVHEGASAPFHELKGPGDSSQQDLKGKSWQQGYSDDPVSLLFCFGFLLGYPEIDEHRESSDGSGQGHKESNQGVQDEAVLGVPVEGKKDSHVYDQSPEVWHHLPVVRKSLFTRKSQGMRTVLEGGKTGLYSRGDYLTEGQGYGFVEGHMNW